MVDFDLPKLVSYALFKSAQSRPDPSFTRIDYKYSFIRDESTEWAETLRNCTMYRYAFPTFTLSGISLTNLASYKPRKSIY